jgi:rSAM/selenodomain-associated transferase 2
MISVIIPAFNEQEELPETLRRVALNAVEHEIILADGGSTDSTCLIGEEAGAVIARCDRKQRASQMNVGAAKAQGNALLFLHADTWLNRDSLAQIEKALVISGCVGGGFTRRFRSDSLFLRLTSATADFRCRTLGWFLGDQAIFVRRDTFSKIGGFADRSQFEDLDFCRRMKNEGKLAVIAPSILSSARRFQNGAFSRTSRDLLLTVKYLSWS